MNVLKVIKISLEKEVNRNSYLVIAGEETILIDSGSKHHLPNLYAGLAKYVKIESIQYIILQSNDFLNISSLSNLVENGFKGKIIVNEIGPSYLQDIVDGDILTIEELNFELKLKSGDVITFIETPFMPFPETYMTYINNDKSLFSGHLASQNAHDFADMKTLKTAINNFHEAVIPNVEFVRHALKRIKDFEIKKIYPRLGYPIKYNDIEEVLSSISTYDFYNTKQVVLRKANKNFSYNYIAICNHMLKRLETIYKREEILNVFNNTTIILEKKPSLEIVKTDLKGYKLWNRFFEIIYDKKGVVWLDLLFPIVKKYNSLYNINLPSIYTLKTISQAREISKLDEEKSNLEEKVEDLQYKVDETLDKLLRCPITNLYNERVLKQHLMNNLEQPLKEDETQGLVFMQIDNLASINQKYGNDIGDETLRNLVHLTNRLKDEKTLVFKQNGPGIIVYKQQIENNLLTEFALNLRNEIQDATVFIEPITVSISIVTKDEINEDLAIKDRIAQMIELGTMRIERAKAMGVGQVIDKDTDNVDYIEGYILLIDEDETNQNLMIKIFERIHYKVVIAKDIYEAYSLVESYKIDVIISEINLSKLDGFQFKRRLNESQSYKDIPFIIASHHKNLDVIMRCNLLGVDVILQKPIIPEELVGHVQRFKLKRLKS
ncbi:MAG: response regulator [Candidatus Izimaplasma sp.]|nr:response regulator [Candidatus Izimaplasma bacterium]